MIVDPRIVPGEADADFLASCTHQEVIEKRRFTREQSQARRQASKRIGEQSAIKLLAQLEPEWKVVDANTIRSNYHGADVLVTKVDDPGKQLRIQVKGSTCLEHIQWPMSADTGKKSWLFDLLLVVDAGITLDRLGKFPKVFSVRQPYVAFYVFTRDEVIEAMKACRQREEQVVYIIKWMWDKGTTSKDAIHQFHDIERHRDRFDKIETFLERL